MCVFFLDTDADSSDGEEDEESDVSDYDEFRNLNNISKNGLSIAEVLEKANTQAQGNLKVNIYIFQYVIFL